MSDFFERARSTGFIGVAIIIFMLLGFGTLFLMVFDDRLNGENAAKLRDNVREQAFELYGLEDEVDWAEVKLLEQERIAVVSKELEKTHKVLDVLSRKESDLTTQIEGEKEAVERLGKEQLAYRDDYREFVRNEAIGDTFEELVLSSGKKLTNLKIREILPDKIRFTTQFGTTAATWEELPEDWHERFQVGKGELEEHKAKLEEQQKKRHELAAETQSSRGARLRELELKKSLERVKKSAKVAKDQRNAAFVRQTSLEAKVSQYNLDARSSAINRKSQEMSARKASKEATRLGAQIAVLNDRLRDLKEEERKIEGELSDVKREIRDLE